MSDEFKVIIWTGKVKGSENIYEIMMAEGELLKFENAVLVASFPVIDLPRAGYFKNEWQPIETAPKGEALLVTWTPVIDHPVVAYYHEHDKCWYRGNPMNEIIPPTHWQPLPEPPKND